MDDRLKESISALLDDEGDELALRRVVNQSDHSEVKALWGRYHKVSDMLSTGRHLQGVLSSPRDEVANGLINIDISGQVSEAIEREQMAEPKAESMVSKSADEPFPVNAAKSTNGLFFYRAAIAAMVVLSVLLVFEPFGHDVQSEQESLVALNSSPVESLSGSDLRQVAEKPFTPEHARRLNEYLLRHAENSVSGGRSGVMPLARVASFTITEN